MAGLDWIPNEIIAAARRRTLQAGESLFREGDTVSALFAIDSGRVQMIRHDSNGRPLVLFTAAEGDLFAEAALFADAYLCDAVAAAETVVRVLPKAALLALLDRDPAAARKFTALLAHEVMQLRTRLEVLNIRSASERVLRHLALTVMPDSHAVKPAGTLKDLAAELGLTHEALYRTLADLEAQDLIERSGARIVLKKPLDA
jgi:CRP-like cAMP-binding protein